METGILLREALLTGRLDALPPDVEFLYARCGLLYVFTAAGFHLAAASRIAQALAWPLRHALPANSRARGAVDWGAVLLVTFWLASLAGWSAPMVRAAIYLSLREGARFFEIEASRPWLFVLSLLACAALGRGGPLSFAFGAAAFAGSLLPGKFRALYPWLCTLPLSVLAFGLAPLAGSLWAISFGFVLLRFALPLALLGALADSVHVSSAPLRIATESLLECATDLLARADSLAGGAFWVRPIPWILLAVALLVAGALRRRSPKGAVVAFALGVPTAFAWPGPLLSVLDVGQGDAILLRGPAGALLEDVGPPGPAGHTAVTAGIERLAIAELSDVMLSHFDLDHRGGLSDLLARHRVRGALWFREEDLNAKPFPIVAAAAERAGVAIRFVTDETAPPGLRCWLAPFPEGNDSSPLCRAMLANGRTLLLTGDMSEKAEAWFVRSLPEFPRADFLKVAHHGSKTSSSADFLAASGAREAFISVGARNRYHHPSPEALDRLARAGLRVRRTDRAGSLQYFGTYLSDLIEESIRPPAEANGSRVYPGKPATARWLYAEPAFVK